MTTVASLLKAMTLDEKIGQLTMLPAGLAVTGPGATAEVLSAVMGSKAGSVLNLRGRECVRAIQRVALEETRLGIPLIFGLDVLHGYRTTFPIPLAEAASFDEQLWTMTAEVAAAEAASDGIMLTFGPMLDVSRDPRWGRIAESPGEDPWLGAQFAAAKVKGFQRGRAGASLAATAKHFVAYGAATAGRDYASADVSKRTLHEVYLPPFKAAVDAGVAAVMAAFNDVAGVPMTANRTLLHDLLRGAWHFKGVVISDYNAIAELMNHGVARDIAEAAALALRAGVDIDMASMAYERGLSIALERGLVALADIDAAVGRVLNFKLRLGLFGDPYRQKAAERAAKLCTVERSVLPNARTLARQAARQSIVLLSHHNGVLPVSSDVHKIAVLGPLGEAAGDMLGPWCAVNDVAGVVTIVEGLRRALPSAIIDSASGASFGGCAEKALAAALDLARSADLVILCVGEQASMSGEAASRARPELPGGQSRLFEEVARLDRPVIVVLSSGRPLIVDSVIKRADAVLATWFLGSEAGSAIADVLTGAWNPSGRLPVTWPRDVGQIPIFYGERPSGRPARAEGHFTSKYLDMPTAPQFPFGHGLSYTTFSLANLRTTPRSFGPTAHLLIDVDVRNEGLLAGEETVFLFIHDMTASVARPCLELKGIAKLTLAPGQQGTAHFDLDPQALAFQGLDGRPVLEKGAIEVLVGPCADRSRLLRAEIELLT